MQLPLVTIVTPSYNQVKFLEATILSVLNQDYKNIEYIIIDGGSTDGSVGIIKKYETKLAYWESGSDRGQSHAINKGFAHANGQIFNWLNSDDILMPSAVSIAVRYLIQNPLAGMVFGDRVVVGCNGQILKIMEYPTFNKKCFKINPYLAQETGFFRKEIWERSGGLDESLHYSMDTDLWYKFLMQKSIIYHIPFILGAWREHGLSKSFLEFDGGLKAGKGFLECEKLRGNYLSFFERQSYVRRMFRIIDKIRLLIEKFFNLKKDEMSKIYESLRQTE